MTCKDKWVWEMLVYAQFIESPQYINGHGGSPRQEGLGEWATSLFFFFFAPVLFVCLATCPSICPTDFFHSINCCARPLAGSWDDLLLRLRGSKVLSERNLAWSWKYFFGLPGWMVCLLTWGFSLLRIIRAVFLSYLAWKCLPLGSTKWNGT